MLKADYLEELSFICWKEDLFDRRKIYLMENKLSKANLPSSIWEKLDEYVWLTGVCFCG